MRMPFVQERANKSVMLLWVAAKSSFAAVERTEFLALTVVLLLMLSSPG
jgi:hypothetical protein